MESFSFLKKYTPHAPVRGYTLLEMVVVLAIIGILLAGTIVAESSFNDSLLLTNSAYSIALSLRDAQSYGLSSATVNSTDDTGYGMFFRGDTSYLEFADIYPSNGNSRSGYCPGHTVTNDPSNPEERPGDCIYSTGYDAIVQSYTMAGSFKVSFCAVPLTGVDSGQSVCSSNGSISTLDITFLRPNTETTLFGTVAGATTPLSSATITVTAPNGTSQECIAVSQAGEIAVGNCS